MKGIRSGQQRALALPRFGRWFLSAALVLAAAPGTRGETEQTGEVLTPTEIVRRCDEMLRGEKSFATIEMTITRPAWTRALKMEGWTEGTKNSLIRVLAPPKEKGVTFLKKGREAWQYVPAIDRTIKIPPSMMLQSWLGSDFTNDDVVRADSMVVDYDHQIAGEPEEDGVAYWRVEAVPKPNAPVVWGKVLLKITKSNFVPSRVDYYDEDGRIVKYYETSDVRVIEGRHVATHMVMHDVTRPGYQTSLRYDDITFSPDLDPDPFTLRSLTR